MTTDKKPRVWINIGINIKDIRIDGQEVIYKPTERTYTKAEMEESFTAGLVHGVSCCCSPSFDEFIERLNTPKP